MSSMGPDGVSGVTLTADDLVLTDERTEVVCGVSVRRFAPLADADRAAIDRALTQTGGTPMTDRAVDRLSGGELQRAWPTTCLAQQNDVVLSGWACRLIPVPVLLGAVLPGPADAFGRTVIAAAQIPAGLAVSLIGASCLVYLLARSRART